MTNTFLGQGEVMSEADTAQGDVKTEEVWASKVEILAESTVPVAACCTFTLSPNLRMPSPCSDSCS